MQLFHPNPLELHFSNETYQIILPRGTYILEAYGASGGGDPTLATTAKNTSSADSCIFNDDEIEQFHGNTLCKIIYSQPGAGAYVKGKLKLLSATTIFVHTGGQGVYDTGIIPGGHNGGGNGYSETSNKAGSGGGATDFRVLNDSLFNRFLVAGAGGGSDDGDTLMSNDGSGGSGGLPGQGMWAGSRYKAEYETNTTYGFSFGYGQNSYKDIHEYAGAGSGFFGGFSINDPDAGGSGGSSFALSDGVAIPEGVITVKDGEGNIVEEDTYKLKDMKEFYLTEVIYATGVWTGDGMARITFLGPYNGITCHQSNIQVNSIIISLLFTILHSSFSQ